MSRKNAAIASLIKHFQGQGLPANYLAFFDCFNRQLFYEAHDVLEALWLPVRKTEKGDFYKGLIQLAGAFVHLQKHRLGPAAALLKLARANLTKYPVTHEGLDLSQIIALIDEWLRRMAAEGATRKLLTELPVPRLEPPAP